MVLISKGSINLSVGDAASDASVGLLVVSSHLPPGGKHTRSQNGQ